MCVPKNWEVLGMGLKGEKKRGKEKERKIERKSRKEEEANCLLIVGFRLSKSWISKSDQSIQIF